MMGGGTAQFILSIFNDLYMFRATMCSSSGETSVLMRHLVLFILCGCLSGMQGAYQTDIHTVVSPDDGHIVARNM